MFAHLVVLGLLGQVDGPATDPAALLERLGSARKAEQEAAKSLEGLGARALPALRQALKSRDSEVRSRARAMIRTIEGNLLTRESPVRLDFENATPGEVARSISRQVGFEVGLGALGPNPGAYRITIHEAGPVPFWDAIDRICSAVPLTFELQSAPRRGLGLPTSLQLCYRPQPATPPSSNQGPFHVSVDSLYFQSQVSYQGTAPVSGQPFPGIRMPAPGPFRGDDPPAQPEPPRAEAGKASTPIAQPDRAVQFQVRLRLVAEPRMFVRQAGQVRLSEAVDDLGNSLLLSANEIDPTASGMAMMPGRGTATTFLGIGTTSLMTPLRRPERPGKSIKKLKGLFEVIVAAPRPDPLVIPLAGSPGKTFENDEWRVLVKSFDRNDNRGQHVIELQVDDLEDHAGAGPLDGPIGGFRGGLGGQGSITMFGPNSPRGLIQVVTTEGQSVSYQSTMHGNSGRLTLRINAVQPGGNLKELRITSQVIARTKVAFEFRDLPMP